MKKTFLRTILFTLLLSASAGSYIFLSSVDTQVHLSGETIELEEAEENSEVTLPDLTLIRKVYQWTKELIYMI